METKVVYYWLITKNLTNNKLLYLGKEFRILYIRQNIFFFTRLLFSEFTILLNNYNNLFYSYDIEIW